MGITNYKFDSDTYDVCSFMWEYGYKYKKKRGRLCNNSVKV